MTKSLKLIYFQGCPNAEKARNLLSQAGLKFDEILQDGLPKDHSLKSYSSPSILFGDEIVAGTKLQAGADGSCSIFKLTKKELMARLKRS